METTQELSEVAQLVLELARALVNHPEHVQMREVTGPSQTILECVIAGGEFGRVIGKGGRLADAARELTRAMGGRARRKYHLSFEEGNATSRHSVSERGEEENDEDVRALLERLIRALVDVPAAARVTVLSGRQASLLEVEVAPEDMCRVIGRAGAVAEAARSLLSSVGAKIGRQYIMALVEPDRTVDRGAS